MNLSIDRIIYTVSIEGRSVAMFFALFLASPLAFLLPTAAIIYSRLKQKPENQLLKGVLGFVSILIMGIISFWSYYRGFGTPTQNTCLSDSLEYTTTQIYKYQSLEILGFYIPYSLLFWPLFLIFIISVWNFLTPKRTPLSTIVHTVSVILFISLIIITSSSLGSALVGRICPYP